MKTLEEAREALLDDLSNQFAHGILDDMAYEELTSQVVTATTAAEIEALRQSLPALRGTQRAARTGAPQTLTAILGERVLRGDWLTAHHVQATVILGSMELDLRDCDIPDGTILSVTVGLGELKIKLPSNVRVDNGISAILAEVRDRSAGRRTKRGPDALIDASPPGGRPLLRLTGSVVLAEVTILTE